jgi:hypothetical protein
MPFMAGELRQTRVTVSKPCQVSALMFCHPNSPLEHLSELNRERARRSQRSAVDLRYALPCLGPVEAITIRFEIA